MKKYSILVLGGYGTVGSVATNDLINSWYRTVIAGRNEEKMKKMITEKNNPLLSYRVVDLNDKKSLMQEFAKYDVILNCLEYTFNKKIIQICADIGVHYVDLGDDYAGIKNSISHNWDFSKKNKIDSAVTTKKVKVLTAADSLAIHTKVADSLVKDVIGKAIATEDSKNVKPKVEVAKEKPKTTNNKVIQQKPITEKKINKDIPREKNITQQN